MSEPVLPVAAMVYGPGQGPAMDALLEDLAHRLASEGLRLAGAVQHTLKQPSMPRCDMVLEDLGTHGIHPISVDRSIAVQGCRMEPSAVENLAMLASQAIERGVDAFILNRFGKNEAAGRGYREVISNAVSLGVPVLVGVSAANLEKWEAFATSGYRRLDVDTTAARQWFAAAIDARDGQETNGRHPCFLKT